MTSRSPLRDQTGDHGMMIKNSKSLVRPHKPSTRYQKNETKGKRNERKKAAMEQLLVDHADDVAETIFAYLQSGYRDLAGGEANLAQRLLWSSLW
jgi:hypothetical protein